MAEATKGKGKEKAKLEPIGGSVNVSATTLSMARQIAAARQSSIRAVTEAAVSAEFRRKFGKDAVPDER